MKVDKNLGNVYEWTGPTGVKFRDVRQKSGAYYHDTTPDEVVQALENMMQTDQRVRLFIGDRKTGVCWHDEFHVTGRVSMSMGPHKIPILVANRTSSGGTPILTDCIVRLLVEGREVYRHPKYKVPNIEVKGIAPITTSSLKNDKDQPYLAEAYIDGKLHARFTSEKAAHRWAAFMRGERMGK